MEYEVKGDGGSLDPGLPYPSVPPRLGKVVAPKGWKGRGAQRSRGRVASGRRPGFGDNDDRSLSVRLERSEHLASLGRRAQRLGVRLAPPARPHPQAPFLLPLLLHLLLLFARVSDPYHSCLRSRKRLLESHGLASSATFCSPPGWSAVRPLVWSGLALEILGVCLPCEWSIAPVALDDSVHAGRRTYPHAWARLVALGGSGQGPGASVEGEPDDAGSWSRLVGYS